MQDLGEIKTKYRIIYCDPPWAYQDKLGFHGGGAESHYPTMSMEELKKLPVNKIADENCALFIWVTMPLLQEGLETIKAWGFEYKTCAFCWIKTNPTNAGTFIGIGRWVQGNAELCLLATKGKPRRVRSNSFAIR